MDPNQLIEELNKPSPLLAAATRPTNSGSDSAILFLDGTDPFGQVPFAPPAPAGMPSMAAPASGHQILDQVQRELQFLPSGNESSYHVTGTLSASASPSRAQTGGRSAGPSGSMTNGDSTVNVVPPVVDTDYLIGTDPISLGSPMSPGEATNGPTSNKVKYSIWQFDYYAQYFDLSTDIFFRRVLWSFLPLTGDHKGTSIVLLIFNFSLYFYIWCYIAFVFLSLFLIPI